MLPEEVLIENPARKGAVPARPLGDEARGIGMNTIGKIFVFAVLIMSVVFMSFAVAIFASHTNWKKESEDLQKELAKVTEERQQKEAAITKLNEDLAASKAARDRVVAALQAALVEKNSELAELQKKRDDQLTKLDEDIAELTKAKQERDEAEKLIAKLRDEIKETAGRNWRPNCISQSRSWRWPVSDATSWSSRSVTLGRCFSRTVSHCSVPRTSFPWLTAW
ncbi:hypothetical protein EBU58_14855 [bacterium]|nr:hypothetical protein [bacterium]